MASYPSDVKWNNFLETEDMERILNAVTATDLPKSKVKWIILSAKACRIYEELDADGLADYITTAYPTVCLLMKAALYFRIYPGAKARELIFHEEPSINMVHAAASCVKCPYTVAAKLLRPQDPQLLVLVPTGKGKSMPLHILCRRAAPRHHDLNKKSLIHLFTESCCEAATLVDYDGYYPLHRACKSKYTWATGIESLMKAAPQMIGMTCENKSPFVISALAHAGKHVLLVEEVTIEQTTLADLEVTETLFELLNQDPTVLKHSFS